jgi:hypothetical protein
MTGLRQGHKKNIYGTPSGIQSGRAVSEDTYLTGVTPLGQKHDHGKPRLSLLPYAALEAAAHVMAHGADKYGERNYRQGMDAQRYVDAALRHLHQHTWQGPKDESGLPHLAHALASLMIAIDLDANGENI